MLSKVRSLASLRSIDASTSWRAEVDEICATRSLGEIAAMSDLVLRNRCITARYHRISRDMQGVVGAENATWCTFAKWASEQAGRSIRGENVPLASLDPMGFATRVRDVISDGNLKVFVEIAPVFERFVLWMHDDAEADARARAHAEGPAALEALVREALDLDPRSLEESPFGQELLAGAFASYVEASWERDADARAELVFIGNAMVGLHEQTRIDGEVQGALAMPELAAALGAAPARRVVGVAKRLAVRTLSRPLARAAKLLVRRAREAASAPALGTQLLMELEVGGERLALSDDLSPIAGRHFPAHLESFEVSRPHLRARLVRVLALDKTPHSLHGSAARDWTRLDERMNFILDLFRSRQQSPAVFGDPLAA